MELGPWSNTRHETAQFEIPHPKKPYVHHIAIQPIPYPASKPLPKGWEGGFDHWRHHRENKLLKLKWQWTYEINEQPNTIQLHKFQMISKENKPMMFYYCLCAFPHSCEMPTHTCRLNFTQATIDTSIYFFISKAELYNQWLTNYLPSENQWGGNGTQALVKHQAWNCSIRNTHRRPSTPRRRHTTPPRRIRSQNHSSPW